MQAISIRDAKTWLSALVDQAAAADEIIIMDDDVPGVGLGPIQQHGERRKPINTMCITHISADFDAPDEAISGLFEG